MYGVLKTVSGNQTIGSKYENSIITGDNYLERRALMEKYEAIIFNK